VIGVVLALGSALAYGLADFAGGLLSRRASYVAVTALGQLGGLVGTVIAASVIGANGIGAADLLWGAISGAGTGMGMLFLYRAMSREPMSVAVPVSAVTGVAVPLLVAIIIMGERPSTLGSIGILVSLPALWLVSRRRDDSGARSSFPVDSLIAGVGIGVQYLALAYPSPAAGLWPLAAGRLVAVVAVSALLLRPGAARIGSNRLRCAALALGLLLALALALYTLATRTQLVSTAVVLSSLYPAVPVILGISVLHERPSLTQVCGLVAATAAVLLITVG
jgi:drug/metabolite transporter (DMT)-like permease